MFYVKNYLTYIIIINNTYRHHFKNPSYFYNKYFTFLSENINILAKNLVLHIGSYQELTKGKVQNCKYYVR